MERLPALINIDGKDYILEETQFSIHAEVLPSWWSFIYRPLDGKGLPPYVHNKHEWYYLCTVDEDKEKAYNDMVERFTTMIGSKTEEMIMIDKFLL